MHLSLKSGVTMFGIRPEMVLASTIVASVYAEFNNSQCVITSITDGKHGDHTHHHKGFAIDFRTRHIPTAQHNLLLIRVQTALGDEFQAILEKDHLHVEFDPK